MCYEKKITIDDLRYRHERDYGGGHTQHRFAGVWHGARWPLLPRCHSHRHRRRAFMYCTGLKQLTVPNSMRIVGSQAFENTGIEQLDLGHGVQFIMDRAFNVVNITSLTLPASLDSLYSNNFRYSRQITDIVIEDSPRTLKMLGREDYGNGSFFHLDNPYTVYQGRNIESTDPHPTGHFSMIKKRTATIIKATLSTKNSRKNATGAVIAAWVITAFTWHYDGISLGLLSFREIFTELFCQLQKNSYF